MLHNSGTSDVAWLILSYLPTSQGYFSGPTVQVVVQESIACHRDLEKKIVPVKMITHVYTNQNLYIR